MIGLAANKSVSGARQERPLARPYAGSKLPAPVVRPAVPSDRDADGLGVDCLLCQRLPLQSGVMGNDDFVVGQRVGIMHDASIPHLTHPVKS